MSSQREAALIFAQLTSIHPDWSHRIAWLPSLHHASAFAVLAAGGTVLAAAPDATLARAALHSGACDFLVTSLDEAIRALKNEVRKGTPISVAVSQTAQALEAEMQTIGLTPDITLPFEATTSVHIAESPAATPAERRTLDAQLLAAANTPAAKLWLRNAPRLFPRDLVRVYFS